jgi:hypothetical protein
MTRAIKIEKNVPIPSQVRRRATIYPFAEMEQGDSIFVPCKSAREKSRATSAAAVYAKNHGMKFKTRTVPGGVRIWLVSLDPSLPKIARAA